MSAGNWTSCQNCVYARLSRKLNNHQGARHTRTSNVLTEGAIMPQPLRAVPLRRLPRVHAALGYLRRRRVVGASLTMVTLRRASAQTPWPSQPIRLLVGFPPGGSSDIPARALAQAIG